MMSHAWAIMLRGGMLSPRGYPPLYALMIVSHRVLRYASPLLHLAALGATLALLRAGPVYRAALLAQAGLLAAAAAGGAVRLRPLLIARYYVATTAALGAGLARPPAPRHARRSGRRRRARDELPGKRALDVLIAGTLLVVSAPLLAIAAVLIRIETHGHPIYRQRRVGRDGEPFELYKLRTMVSGAESMGAGARARRGRRAHHAARRGAAPDVAGRAAEPGQRAARRDVGRRPAPDGAGPGRPLHASASAAASRCRPGLTGWAQIHGRASLPWNERIELDLWYVEHASLARGPADPVADGADGARRRRALQGRDRRLAGAAARRERRRNASVSRRQAVLVMRDTPRRGSRPIREDERSFDRDRVAHHRPLPNVPDHSTKGVPRCSRSSSGAPRPRRHARSALPGAPVVTAAPERAPAAATRRRLAAACSRSPTACRRNP